MQGIRTRLLQLICLGCLSTLAHAAPDCGADSNAVTYTEELGPRHHPVGRPLPHGPQFNQPTACGDSVWFFDMNRNERPDPGEPKLFGPQRTVACGSCHADSPDATTPTAASVFLRQDPQVLCLVCHRL